MNNASKKSNTKVLVRLMTCTGGEFLDVRLEEDGYQGSHNVFGTVKFHDIVKVENELVEM